MAAEFSHAIVLKDQKILLLDRVNKVGECYHSFPGGHVEAQETPLAAAIRETQEETSIQINPIRFIYEISWDNGNKNHYLLAEYISGEPQLSPDSEEKRDVDAGLQMYRPEWFPLEKLNETVLYPLEVRDMLLEDMKSNFSRRDTHHLYLKIAEKRIR